jgi:heptosyltransferase-2
MGDVILAASVFDVLKHSHPGVEIHFLTSRRYSGLFNKDPRLASVMEYDGNGMEDALRKCGSWDMIADLQNSSRSRRITKRYLSSPTVGRLDKMHLRRLVLLAVRVDIFASAKGIIQRYAAAAGSGKAFPARLYTGNENVLRRRFLENRADSEKPTLAIMPFSAWKNKQWTMESFASVGRYFADKGWGVAVLGGPQDDAAGLKLAEKIGAGAVSMAGKADLYDNACFLKTCKLALGVDTGLSHMARACNVKTGIIYGPTTWHFGFFPFGEPAFRVFEKSLFCRPCHAHGGNFCWRFNRECMVSVRPEVVIKGMEDLLANRVS